MSRNINNRDTVGRDTVGVGYDIPTFRDAIMSYSPAAVPDEVTSEWPVASVDPAKAKELADLLTEYFEDRADTDTVISPEMVRIRDLRDAYLTRATPTDVDDPDGIDFARPKTPQEGLEPASIQSGGSSLNNDPKMLGLTWKADR